MASSAYPDGKLEEDLEGLRDQSQKMGLRIATLEETVSKQQSTLDRLFEETEEMKIKLRDMVSKTSELETAVAKVAKAQIEADQARQDLEEKQELKDLMQNVLSIYTPKLLCLIVKNQAHLKPGRAEMLVYLNEQYNRFSQIFSTYEPGSNYSSETNPLDQAVIASRRTLPTGEQEDTIRRFWDGIVWIFNNDNGRCIQYVVEEKLNQLNTFEEKKAFLVDYISYGQGLLKCMKKSKRSFFRFLIFGN